MDISVITGHQIPFWARSFPFFMDSYIVVTTFINYYGTLKPQLQKTFLETYTSREDSDQHSRSLIRIFAECILDRKDVMFLNSDNGDSDQTARMGRLI